MQTMNGLSISNELCNMFFLKTNSEFLTRNSHFFLQEKCHLQLKKLNKKQAVAMTTGKMFDNIISDVILLSFSFLPLQCGAVVVEEALSGWMTLFVLVIRLSTSH